MLAGTHDFSAFRAAECQAKSPVKTLATIELAASGDFVRFDFSANAFLHHMIRNIVGALVYVGAGKEPVPWIAELLAARDRTHAAPTFAPDGLYLTGVDYDAKWGLPPTRRAGFAAARVTSRDEAHAHARQDLRHHPRRGRPRRGACRRRRDRARLLAGHAARA